MTWLLGNSHFGWVLLFLSAALVSLPAEPDCSIENAMHLWEARANLLHEGLAEYLYHDISMSRLMHEASPTGDVFHWGDTTTRSLVFPMDITVDYAEALPTLAEDPFSTGGLIQLYGYGSTRSAAYGRNQCDYLLWSAGPDGLPDLHAPKRPADIETTRLLQLSYDPTNGLRSRGDLFSRPEARGP